MRFRALKNFVPLVALLFIVTGCPGQEGGGGGGGSRGGMQNPGGGGGGFGPQGGGLQQHSQGGSGPQGFGPQGGGSRPQGGSGGGVPPKPGTTPRSGSTPRGGTTSRNGSTPRSGGTTARRGTTPRGGAKPEGGNESPEGTEELADSSSHARKRLKVPAGSGDGERRSLATRDPGDDEPGARLAGAGRITGGRAGVSTPVLGREEEESERGDVSADDPNAWFDKVHGDAKLSTKDKPKRLKWVDGDSDATEPGGLSTPSTRGALATAGGRHPQTSVSVLCEKESRAYQFTSGTEAISPGSIQDLTFTDSANNKGAYRMIAPSKKRTNGLMVVLRGDPAFTEKDKKDMEKLAEDIGRTVVIVEPVGDLHPETKKTSFWYGKGNDVHLSELLAQIGKKHRVDRDDVNVLSWSGGATFMASEAGEAFGKTYQGLAIMACGSSLRNNTPVPSEKSMLDGFHPYILGVEGDDVNPFVDEAISRYKQSGVKYLAQTYPAKDDKGAHCNFPKPLSEIAAEKINKRDELCRAGAVGARELAMEISGSTGGLRNPNLH